MKRFVVGAFAVAILASAGAVAGEALKSGLPVGGGPPVPFNPLSVTGPFQGKKQCLV
jgi:hypothetical protein